MKSLVRISSLDEAKSHVMGLICRWLSQHLVNEIELITGSGDDDSPNKRRSRTNFNAWQLEEMERVFCVTHYPDNFVRETLARRLDLKESRIAVSFHLHNAVWEWMFWVVNHRFGFKTDELNWGRRKTRKKVLADPLTMHIPQHALVNRFL